VGGGVPIHNRHGRLTGCRGELYYSHNEGGKMTDKQREAIAYLEREHDSIIGTGDASDFCEGWVWVFTPDTREVPMYDDRIRSWYVDQDGRIHA